MSVLVDRASHNTGQADGVSREWEGTLRARRARADALRALGPAEPLRGDAGAAALARLREAARPLLERVASAFGDLCPEGYPQIEDNQIAGPGGSTGIRFSRWHAFFFALEHVREPKQPAAKPAGLAGALGLHVKRLPGDPLPPPNPNVKLELVTLELRWEETRGWVEVRRPLHPAWDEAMLQERLAAYLMELAYDLVAIRGSKPNV